MDAAFQDVLTSKVPFVKNDIYYKRKNGESIVIRYQINDCADSSGFYWGAFIDITELYETQQKLKQTNEQLKKALYEAELAKKAESKFFACIESTWNIDSSR